MTSDEIYKLIEDNGLALHGDIEHFAALVIANHPPQSYMTWQEGYEAGKQAERERILDMCKEGLWDAEGIRYHLDKQERGQA